MPPSPQGNPPPGIWTFDDCFVQIPVLWDQNCAQMLYPSSKFDGQSFCKIQDRPHVQLCARFDGQCCCERLDQPLVDKL